MKLSEIKGEKSIDVLADLIEPASTIFSDEKVQKLFSEEATNKSAIIKYLLKNYKKEIIEIVAILNGETPEKCNINVFTLPKLILEILSDEELLSFFSQSLTD